MPSPLRLMAVHAHPDDESSKGAATTAKYVAEGVEVMVVSCTGGERGDVLNPAAAAEVEADGLAEVRRREMAQAARVLGVRHAWLGFEDSGFPSGDPPPPLPDGCFAVTPLEISVPPLVALIREFRPQVLTTYDEEGGYPHPDHIRCHEVSMAAVAGAADPGYHPELGEPWQVAKVYYNRQFSRARVVALHLAMIDADLDSPYHDWVKDIESRPDDAHRVTTKVEAAEWFPVRDEALKAHRTQIDPDGRWFAVPMDVQREVWPTEDFELAMSIVDTTLPENDLFSGIEELMLIRLADQEELKAVIDRAGPIALIFVVALGVAVFLIARSMNRQMKKINPDLPKGVDEERRAADQRYTEEAIERGRRAAAEQGEDEQPHG